jgi:hypothetical protein
VNSRPQYKKHIYWITKADERNLREKMEAQQEKIDSAKGVPCRPLNKKIKLAIVEPDDWNRVCSRQGSWYRSSEKNDLYLVISAFNIEGYEEKKEGIITLSDFTPSESATTKEKEEMIEDPEFQDMVPDEWKDVDEMEEKITLKWARRFGSDVKDYDLLFLSHTANHSNFINPRFYIQDNHGIIPYSIERSAHLCSCCLELFHIIGGRFSKKMVSPCTGAVVYARLKPDQYMLVEKNII